MQKESSFILKNWTLYMYLCDYTGGFNCGFLFYVVHRSNFGKSLVVKRIELYGCVCVYIDECDCVIVGFDFDLRRLTYDLMEDIMVVGWDLDLL